MRIGQSESTPSSFQERVVAYESLCTDGLDHPWEEQQLDPLNPKPLKAVYVRSEERRYFCVGCASVSYRTPRVSADTDKRPAELLRQSLEARPWKPNWHFDEPKNDILR